MALKVVSYDPEQGTALVSLDGVERELKATFSLDRMVVSGLAVRYRTGKRVWAASFTYWFASGNINNIHPPMDHRARRATVSVVGFIDDFRKPVNAVNPVANAQQILLSAKGFSCHECGNIFVYRSLSETPNPNGVEPKDMVPAYCPDCGTELSEAEPFEITETELKFEKGGN